MVGIKRLFILNVFVFLAFATAGAGSAWATSCSRFTLPVVEPGEPDDPMGKAIWELGLEALESYGVNKKLSKEHFEIGLNDDYSSVRLELKRLPPDITPEELKTKYRVDGFYYLTPVLVLRTVPRSPEYQFATLDQISEHLKAELDRHAIADSTDPCQKVIHQLIVEKWVNRYRYLREKTVMGLSLGPTLAELKYVRVALIKTKEWGDLVALTLEPGSSAPRKTPIRHSSSHQMRDVILHKTIKGKTGRNLIEQFTQELVRLGYPNAASRLPDFPLVNYGINSEGDVEIVGIDGLPMWPQDQIIGELKKTKALHFLLSQRGHNEKYKRQIAEHIFGLFVEYASVKRESQRLFRQELEQEKFKLKAENRAAKAADQNQKPAAPPPPAQPPRPDHPMVAALDSAIQKLSLELPDLDGSPGAEDIETPRSPMRDLYSVLNRYPRAISNLSRLDQLAATQRDQLAKTLRELLVEVLASNLKLNNIVLSELANSLQNTLLELNPEISLLKINLDANELLSKRNTEMSDQVARAARLSQLVTPPIAVATPSDDPPGVIEIKKRRKQYPTVRQRLEEQGQQFKSIEGFLEKIQILADLRAEAEAKSGGLKVRAFDSLKNLQAGFQAEVDILWGMLTAGVNVSQIEPLSSKSYPLSQQYMDEHGIAEGHRSQTDLLIHPGAMGIDEFHAVEIKTHHLGDHLEATLEGISRNFETAQRQLNLFKKHYRASTNDRRAKLRKTVLLGVRLAPGTAFNLPRTLMAIEASFRSQSSFWKFYDAIDSVIILTEDSEGNFRTPLAHHWDMATSKWSPDWQARKLASAFSTQNHADESLLDRTFTVAEILSQPELR